MLRSISVFILLLVFLLRAETAYSQQDTIIKYGVSQKQEAEYQAWLDNLYEMGVVVDGDSVFISEEARRTVTDSAYRAILYPATYNWGEAQYLLKQMQLKIGFWYLINLYIEEEKNKEIVLNFILPFDEILEMDKVLLAVFYTYGLLDPAVASLENGKPNIKHPEIVEKKLAAVKEIVSYVLAYRIQKENQKAKE
jgi:hypothetical protein